MKDAAHCNLDSVVVGIDLFGVVRAACGTQRLGGREQRLDGFVSEYQERGDGAKTGRGWLVAPAVADARNDLFAAKFLQIIGGMARAVLGSIVR